MKYIVVKSQNNNIHICKDIVIKTHNPEDYDNPYWICSDNDYILGCYKTFERVKKINNEIFECNGKYVMPKN